MSKKAKRKLERLNNIFSNLGFGEPSYDDAPSAQRAKIGYRLENKCGKVCFESQSCCNEAIRFRLRKGANTDKMRSYFCDTCKAWHMSSSFHKR